MTTYDQWSRRSRDFGLAAEHRGNFRLLLGMILGGFGAMLGAMAHGFHWL
jgi:hypothetical protein